MVRIGFHEIQDSIVIFGVLKQLVDKGFQSFESRAKHTHAAGASKGLLPVSTLRPMVSKCLQKTSNILP